MKTSQFLKKFKRWLFNFKHNLDSESPEESEGRWLASCKPESVQLQLRPQGIPYWSTSDWTDALGGERSVSRSCAA